MIGDYWKGQEHSPTGLDSTKLVILYLIQQKQSSWILTSQTGGHLYSDTSSHEVSEFSLDKVK